MKEKRTIDFYKKIVEEHDGQCFTDSIVDRDTVLSLKCKNGHCWETRAKNLCRGFWCYTCTRLTDEDHDFFSRDTEESFYVAGFWAADGCKRYKNHSYILCCNLSVKDFDHMEKLKKAIGTKNEITKHISDNSGFIKSGQACEFKEYEMCSLSMYSQKMYNDLERFGVTERKTATIDIPEWLKVHPMVNHFLRGYFDGDGSYIKTKRNTISFDIKGNRKVIQSIQDILHNNGILGGTRKLKNDKYVNLKFTGNIVMDKMYHFLYDNSTLYMDKKKAIIEQAKSLQYKMKIPRDSVELVSVAKQYNGIKEMSKHYSCSESYLRSVIRKLNINNEIKSRWGG